MLPTNRLTIALAAALVLPTASYAWQPGPANPTATSGFTVNTSNRLDVLGFHHTAHTASKNFAANMAWTGNIATGQAGTTSAAFKNDTLRRINYYRAMAGLPGDITFDAVKSGKCQEAALMFSAQNALSHTPPTSWAYWTANASEAASKSNIAIGNFGPSAVDAYMTDDGIYNAPVGHRRWLLYSRAQFMGTGDVPASGSYNSANAIWVVGDPKTAPTPKFVPWPAAGYFPDVLLPARWSLSYPGANFASASVTMVKDGQSMLSYNVSTNQTGIGDNTLVWECEPFVPPAADDVVIQVTVSGISGSGVPTSHSYTVRVFNVDVLGTSTSLVGPNNPPATGNTAYTFSPITGVDGYQIRVSKESTSAWSEGAEDPGTMVEMEQSTPYTLRQSSVKRSGSKAFQLAFADSNDQEFTLLHDVIPTAQSQLVFYQLGRFATDTTTAVAEVSPDAGATWDVVWARVGAGLSSALWDPSFQNQTINLDDYAGKRIRVRFRIQRNGGSYVPGVNANNGFFFDDVTVTNAKRLVNQVTTNLGNTATSFTLNPTSGGTLTVGETYHLQVSPLVGTKQFAYGPSTTFVPIQPPTGYDGWVGSFPGIGTPDNDHDKDGIPNLVEYAFNGNPITPNGSSLIPTANRAGNLLGFSFTPPADRTDLVYGAEWSDNLTVWHTITNSGTAPQKTFQVDTTGKPTVFLRHRIIRN